MITIRRRHAGVQTTMRRPPARSLAIPFVALLLAATAWPIPAPAQPAVPDQGLQALQALYAQIEDAVRDGDQASCWPPSRPALPEEQAAVLIRDMLWTTNTRAVVKERDRIVLPNAPLGTGFRVVVEIFVESGNSARIATYRTRCRPAQSGGRPMVDRRGRAVDARRWPVPPVAGRGPALLGAGPPAHCRGLPVGDAGAARRSSPRPATRSP